MTPIELKNLIKMVLKSFSKIENRKVLAFGRPLMIGHDDLIPMADNYFKNIDISGQIGNQIVAMRNGL